MATTPPPEQRPTTTTGMSMGMARMPIPGNAEFLYVVLAALLVMIIAWIADSISVSDWLLTFTAISFAYLIGRGIAKASRVLEQ